MGAGRPALYEHDNLATATHARVHQLFGGTSMHYFRHVRAMVRAGTAVKYARHDPSYAALPDDYFAHAREIATPILFLTGDRNHVFTNSNVVCYERLRGLAVGDRHELAILPGYGHQDVFMGKDAHHDVFPRIVAFLERQRALGRAAA